MRAFTTSGRRSIAVRSASDSDTSDAPGEGGGATWSRSPCLPAGASWCGAGRGVFSTRFASRSSLRLEHPKQESWIWYAASTPAAKRPSFCALISRARSGWPAVSRGSPGSSRGAGTGSSQPRRCSAPAGPIREGGIRRVVRRGDAALRHLAAQPLEERLGERQDQLRLDVEGGRKAKVIAGPDVFEGKRRRRTGREQLGDRRVEVEIALPVDEERLRGDLLVRSMVSTRAERSGS